MEATAYSPAKPKLLFVDDERRMLTFWLSLATVGITMWVLLGTVPESRTVIFSGSYVSDPLSQVLKLALCGFVALAFVYA